MNTKQEGFSDAVQMSNKNKGIKKPGFITSIVPFGRLGEEVPGLLMQR